MVASLGADEVIDRTTHDPLTAAGRYDVILQVTGEPSALRCRRALAADGTLVQISGDSPGRWIGPIRRLVAGRLLSPFVGQRITSVSATPDNDDLRLLAGLVADGTITPVIDRTYPLADVVDALAHVEAGRASGKVLIRI
jgi:NADPH:quinone reductase-like Zn-dependent oxidoreductase